MFNLNLFNKKNTDHNNYNTFEFVDLNTCCQEVKNLKSFFKKKRTFVRLFKDTFIKIKKPDFYDNPSDLKKMLEHPTIGIPMTQLIKGQWIPGSYFVNLGDAIVKDNSILIMLNKHLAITESYGHKNWLKFQINRWPNAHNYKESKILFSKNLYIKKKIKIYEIEKKLKIIKKKAIYLSAINEGNFFHWIFDTLSKLRCLEISSKLKKFPLIIRSPLLKYQKETLQIFGITNKIIITNKSSYKANNLFFSSLSSPPAYNIDTIKWLRKKFLKGVKKNNNKKFERIYISREDAQHRKVKNSIEIENMLHKYKFKKYVLSKYSVKEQVNIFRNANCIIMPHGSAGSHILNSPKKCTIIELHSPKQLNNMFCCLSKILGLKYGFLIGEEADNKNNFCINVNSLEKLINKFL